MGGSTLTSTPTESDADLLLRVARGDGSSFPECIDRFGPLVWTLARTLLANRIDAEDAVQEAFAELWRVAGRFDPAIAPARAFVATIARRRMIDRGRMRQRSERDGSSALTEATPDRGQNPAERAVQGESRRTAMAEFGRLRPEQQKVLRLAVHENWTHERIAEYLSMPVGTVKTHLRRGLIELRSALLHRADPEREQAQGAAP